jgi:hypothetical protein
MIGVASLLLQLFDPEDGTAKILQHLSACLPTDIPEDFKWDPCILSVCIPDWAGI